MTNSSHQQVGLKWLYFVAIFIALSLVGSQSDNSTLLQKIKARGELRIVTRIGPTTYFIGGNGSSGFEYDLAARFAEYLGVKLSVIATDDMRNVFRLVNSGQVDMAAAGLAITPERDKLFDFSPFYQKIDIKLVFKQGNFWPRDLEQLDGNLTVLAGSSHSELLLRLKQDHPNLSWHENSTLAVDDLVDEVLEGKINYTLLDSNDLILQRRYHPELAVAFTLEENNQLAWAMKKNADHSLYQATAEFFSLMKENQKLANLLEVYYGHLENFDYVGSRRFLRAARKKLQKYQTFFEEAGSQELDWKLLAAISYQESHWNPKARSATGVRGMMMLTLPTAKQLGINNRLDAEESIKGGSKYFLSMFKKFPDRIQEPDRTWLALASYNVGFGHLEDARILTQLMGGNPDKWLDVKEHLPLLRQRKWYKQTRYGYARGDEPVQYVDNIRRYYEVLNWIYENQEKNTDHNHDQILATNQ